MKHKCDLCENEATVHEVVIRNGQKVERHLCENHAKQSGIVQVHSHVPIHELIPKFVMSASGGAPQTATGSVCQNCSLSFNEFRQHGVLGCPQCYAAFEKQLSPLLERAHDGGTHHVGKIPVRGGESLDRHERITALRRMLNEAIAAEEYERAAELRDEIDNYHGVNRSAREAGSDESALKQDIDL